MRIKNFLFHRVTDEVDRAWPPMTPELFDYTIRFLKKNYTLVTIEDFAKDPEEYKQSPRQLASISFDDGYKDNIEYAAPILEKYKAPASFYVVTDSIDRNQPTWTYLADHFIQHTRKKEIELALDFVPDVFRKIFPGDVSVRALKPFMKSLPNKERTLILDHLLAQCDDVVSPANKMMSWDDIRELQGRGFVIGSHSHTHPMLGALESGEEIASELNVSAARLLEETGAMPETISYPIGSYDDRVKRLAKKAGYKYGLAVNQAFWNSPFADVFGIPRVELHNEPVWKLRMRINGLYFKIRSLVK